MAKLEVAGRGWVFALAVAWLNAGCALSATPSSEGGSEDTEARTQAIAAPAAPNAAPTANPKTNRTPGEHAPVGDTTITWSTLPGTKLTAERAVRAVLTNQMPTVTNGQVFLVASGLDGQLTRTPLESISLVKDGQHAVSVPVKSLPLQSSTSPSFAQLEVVVTRKNGQKVTLSSLPLYYVFSADYASATFYSAEDVVHLPNGGVSPSAMRGASGRVLTDAGVQVVDRAAQAPTNDVVASPTVAELVLDGAKPTAPATAAAQTQAVPRGATPQTVTTVRVCTTWRVSYADSGQGEDVDTNTSLHDVNAAFAQAELKSGSVLIWSGNLDASGCVQASIGFGSYTLTQHTINMKRVELPTVAPQFNVKYVTSSGTGDLALTTAFAVAQGQPSVTLHPTTNNEAVQVAAIAGIMLTNDTTNVLGLEGFTYEIQTPLGCGTIAPATDSCFDPPSDTVHIGTTLIGGAGGQPDSHYKFIVAHEIGHDIEYKGLSGYFFYSYSDNSTSVPECRCDHYNAAQWGNQEHCIQSREYMGGAEEEAFAHLIATRTFNFDEGISGQAVFVYYKPMLGFFEDDGSESVAYPPIALHMLQNRSPDWMTNFCPSGDTHKGIEYDWLSFYDRISDASIANATNVGNIMGIYLRACDPVDMEECSSQDLTWAQIQSSAQAYWGGSATEPHFTRFRDTASSAGVNF